MRVGLLGVTVAVIAALAGCSDSGASDTTAAGVDAPPSTLATTTTATPVTTTTMVSTTTTSEPEPAFDGVELAMGAIDAWNSGDFDAWLAYWETDEDEDFLFSRSVMNSNERMEVTAPCEITSAPSEPVVVTCSIHVEDDFHGTGGLTSNGTEAFHFNGEGLIVETDSTTYQDENGNCCPQWESIHRAFHSWLSDAHPDVYEEIGPKDGNPSWYLHGVASGNADHMLIALEYVDEFVAQSDVYPLDG